MDKYPSMSLVIGKISIFLNTNSANTAESVLFLVVFIIFL